MHDGVAVDGADHPVRVALLHERAREVHEPAAFGVDRQARVDGAPDRAAQRGVRLELPREVLGKAAADDQRVDVRQAAVGERVEADEPRAGGGRASRSSA